MLLFAVFSKQVKKNATNGIFEPFARERKQVGNPLLMEEISMRGTRNTDRNTRKFISIPDMEKWEDIDKLMTLPKYEKSFNKIINDALDYGLPMLVKAEFGAIDESEFVMEEPAMEEGTWNEEANQQLDELINNLMLLMEEVVLNATINKSLLCSLFNVKSRELSGIPTRVENLKSGAFRDTPEYLESYERRTIREINRRRNKD